MLKILPIVVIISIILGISGYFIFFHNKKSNIPATNCTGAFCTSNNSDWVPGLSPNYINSLPSDPKKDEGVAPPTDGKYGYAYWSAAYTGCPAAGQYYVLYTLLENKNDPQRSGVKRSLWCDGKGLGISQAAPKYDWSDYAYIITSP